MNEEEEITHPVSGSLSPPAGTGRKTKNPSSVRPVVPSLKVEVLSENSSSFVICPPNSRQPIPFETEIFKGVVLIILRTEPLDQHYSSFFVENKFVDVYFVFPLKFFIYFVGKCLRFKYRENLSACHKGSFTAVLKPPTRWNWD